MTTCPLVQSLGPTRPYPVPYMVARHRNVPMHCHIPNSNNGDCSLSQSEFGFWIYPFSSSLQVLISVCGGVAGLILAFSVLQTSTTAAGAYHASHWPGLLFTTLPNNSVLLIWASLHFCNNFLYFLSVWITAAQIDSHER